MLVLERDPDYLRDDEDREGSSAVSSACTAVRCHCQRNTYPWWRAAVAEAWPLHWTMRHQGQEVGW